MSMRKHTNIFAALFAAVAIAGGYVSCDDMDYTTSPSAVLSFSADTVSFDTVFTGVGTSTYTLKVYNRNSKALLISSVSLGKGGDSYYRLNVDGQKGTEFSDITLRSNDSLYVFIGMNMPEQEKDEPVLSRDSLVFVTNGVKQDVKLISYGWDAIPLRGKTILADTTFTSAKPIVVYDSLVVENGATLTCEEGTGLYFHGKAFVKVKGRMVVNGSVSSPVVFRCDRTDNLFSYLSYDRVSGQWGGITIDGGSYDNVFNYADIRGGIYGIRCDSADVSRQKLTMTNSRIHNTSENGLEMTECKADFANCEFSNAGGSCVDLTGGDARFVYCTLANYYTWGIRMGSALSLRNIKGEVVHPVIEAAFNSCIIAGGASDEISGGMAEDKSVPYNYRFHNSLINSVMPEEGDVADCIWEKDDNFVLIDKDNYKYDFRLDSLSKAIGIGSLQDASLWPADRDGRSRVADGQPDAGCYERVADAVK